jgi:hypothetical protein
MTSVYLRYAVSIGSIVSAFVLSASGQPAPNTSPMATVAAPAVGLAIANATVPPGGLLQVQVSLTEPKPILKGRQAVSFAASPVRAAALAAPLAFTGSAAADAAAAASSGSAFAGVRDVALFSPDGTASGVAVLASSGLQFFFRSPLTTFGTSTDAPVMTISMPVKPTAQHGEVTYLNLDPNSAQWLSPSATPYLVEFKPGQMTVGGALSVSDVQPGEGVVNPGGVVTVRGMGFDQGTKIQVNGATVQSLRLMSSTELQFTMAQPVNLRGRRIRVINRRNETVTYFPSRRMTLVGRSTHALVASSFPLYTLRRWTIAYLHPVQGGNVFTAVALANPLASAATVSLRLHSKAGALLAARSLALPAGSQVVRDLAEIFPAGTPLSGTSLQIVASSPVQILEMRGDDASATMLPLDTLSAP